MRRDRLGGLLHEYVLSHDVTGFSAPTRRLGPAGPSLPLGRQDRSHPDRRPQHPADLRFTTDWRIPPDNNGSERDIRVIKLRQKVSGCLRTLTGAAQFCAIRSYLSTAAKHGRALFDALVMLTEGQPWLPETG